MDDVRGWVGMSLIQAVLLALVLLSGCGSRQGNFSQYPGFDTWYAANPPSTQLPDGRQRALLERFRPRLFLGRESADPIRFYEDYIAHGQLRNAQGNLVSERVDQTVLNRHRNDPGMVFSYQPPAREAISNGSGEALARVDREVFPAVAGMPARELLFLTYNFAFAHSGVAAGVRKWQRFLLSFVADLNDWHQLDHYTAVTIAVDASTERPLAAIIQQHNYMRTWLFADQPGPGRLQLPSDQRIRLIAALGSNELYTFKEGRQFRRAVPMMTPDNVDWLVLGKDRPLISADDITDPQREWLYSLRLLPAADAFYVFKGWLGQRRRTPGRDGPPGADYYTIPALKSRVQQLAFFWWPDGDQQYVELFRSTAAKMAMAPESVALYLRRLGAALQSHR